MTGHSVVADNRETLTVTAVADVSNFNEETVLLSLEDGGMTIDGKDLHIVHLNLDEGKVVVQGEINKMTYTQKKKKGEGGLLKRLFK